MKIYNINYPVFVFPLEEHTVIKQPLLQMIEKQNSDTINNAGVLVLTDWNTDIGQNREYFIFLRQFLDKYLDRVLNDTKPYGLTYLYEYDNVWFQQYHESYFHQWHNHNSVWGVIYFLELPNVSVSTEFYIPFSDKKQVQFEVKEGDVIVFPANVFHRSPPNHCADRKTVIVSNLSTHYL